MTCKCADCLDGGQHPKIPLSERPICHGYPNGCMCRRCSIRLNVSTIGPRAETAPCTGDLVCQCADCDHTRDELVKRGVRTIEPSSPFKQLRPAA